MCFEEGGGNKELTASCMAAAVYGVYLCVVVVVGALVVFSLIFFKNIRKTLLSSCSYHT